MSPGNRVTLSDKGLQGGLFASRHSGLGEKKPDVGSNRAVTDRVYK